MGVSERVYNRLLLLAQANGKNLTDYCRERLDLDNVERMPDDEFDSFRKRQDIERARLESRESKRKVGQKAYVVKEWRSARKRRVVVFRAAPYTEFDAIANGERDKAGQYLLRVFKERQTNRNGPWTLDIEERRDFYRSLKLYKKAVNRALGWDHFKIRGKPPQVPVNPTGYSSP